MEVVVQIDVEQKTNNVWYLNVIPLFRTLQWQEYSLHIDLFLWSPGEST